MPLFDLPEYRFPRQASLGAYLAPPFHQRTPLHPIPESDGRGDAWLETYNTARPHHGYRTHGRTPLRVFEKGLEAQREKVTPAA